MWITKKEIISKVEQLEVYDCDKEMVEEHCLGQCQQKFSNFKNSCVVALGVYGEVEKWLKG